MNNQDFVQANLVFTGTLRDNKEKGLDTAAPRYPLEKHDMEKLFNEYSTKTVSDQLDTEILLHKVFFDIMYYTGHRGKEGLRNLSKDSFCIKRSAEGKDYIEITFNEKMKKNQGDSMSVSANALHNNHHIITKIPNSPLCPVESYKRYVSLVNPNSIIFSTSQQTEERIHQRTHWQEHPQNAYERDIHKSWSQQNLHKSLYSQDHSNRDEEKWFHFRSDLPHYQTQESGHIETLC